MGLEPMTSPLPRECSTTELHQPYVGRLRNGRLRSLLRPHARLAHTSARFAFHPTLFVFLIFTIIVPRTRRVQHHAHHK